MIDHVLRRAQDLVSRSNYEGAEDAGEETGVGARPELCGSVVEFFSDVVAALPREDPKRKFVKLSNRQSRTGCSSGRRSGGRCCSPCCSSPVGLCRQPVRSEE
jgi:hypothetical protein